MNSSAFPGICSARHNYCPPFRFFSRSPNILPMALSPFSTTGKKEKKEEEISMYPSPF